MDGVVVVWCICSGASKFSYVYVHVKYGDLNIHSVVFLFRRTSSNSAHLQAVKLLHLVLDQGPQWGHHHGYPGLEEGWQLVAETLSSSRGHEDKAVVAQDGGVHGLQLVHPELAQAKHLGEQLHHFVGVRVGLAELCCPIGVGPLRELVREWGVGK